MLYDLVSPVEPRIERSHTGAFSAVSGQQGEAACSTAPQNCKGRRRLGGMRSSRNNKLSALDDTNTGSERHIASNDFLRVVRVMMFLGPRRGKSTTVGDGRGDVNGPKWKPRTELDVSGHSFRRGIKTDLQRMKAVRDLGPLINNSNDAAKQHLERLRSPTRGATRDTTPSHHHHHHHHHHHTDYATNVDQDYEFWDAEEEEESGKYSSPCYDSSESNSTLPASPPGSPPDHYHYDTERRAISALPPRAPAPSLPNSCSAFNKGISRSSSSNAVAMRNGGRRVWTNELATSDYAIRESGADGEFRVEKVVFRSEV